MQFGSARQALTGPVEHQLRAYGRSVRVAAGTLALRRAATVTVRNVVTSPAIGSSRWNHRVRVSWRIR